MCVHLLEMLSTCGLPSNAHIAPSNYCGERRARGVRQSGIDCGLCPRHSGANAAAAPYASAGTVTFLKSIKEVSETWTDQADQTDPLSI